MLMSHRANYVIVEDGVAVAYFNSYGAMGAIYGAAKGPDEFSDELTYETEEVDELMDSAFAEAAVLIDHDAKQCILYGYSWGPEYWVDGDGNPFPDLVELDELLAESPDKFIAKIQPAWDGWDLKFDERGIDAVTEYLRDNDLSLKAATKRQSKKVAKKNAARKK